MISRLGGGRWLRFWMVDRGGLGRSGRTERPQLGDRRNVEQWEGLLVWRYDAAAQRHHSRALSRRDNTDPTDLASVQQQIADLKQSLSDTIVKTVRAEKMRTHTTKTA